MQSKLNKIPKRMRLPLLMLVVIVLSLPLAIYALKLYQNYKGQAAAGAATLTFSPTSQTNAVGTNGTYNVFVNPNNETVNAVEVYISYDPTKVNVTSISPGPFFTSVSGTVGAPIEIVPVAQRIANGVIHYAIAFPLGSNYSSTAANTALIINYTAISAGTSNFNFLTTSPTQTIVSNVNAANVLGSTTNGTIVVTGPTGTPSPTPTRSPSPSPTPTRSPSPSPSPTSAPGWTRIDERDTTRVTHSANWNMETQTGAYLDTQEWTQTAGATVTFNFTGTGVRFISKIANNHGVANIYIDNVLKQSVDTYAATTQWQVNKYEAVGLTNASHVLKVENVGTAGRPAIVTDAFEYYTGTVTPTPAPPTSTPSPTPTRSPSPTPTRSPSPTPTRTPTPSAPVTASPSSAPKLGDVNGDGVVNIVDIGIVVDNYGKLPITVPGADVNKDGGVDIIDIGIIIDRYGT